MKKVVSSRELTETAKRVAQSKRLKSLQVRKYYVNYNHVLKYMDELS